MKVQCHQRRDLVLLLNYYYFVTFLVNDVLSFSVLGGVAGTKRFHHPSRRLLPHVPCLLEEFSCSSFFPPRHCRQQPTTSSWRRAPAMATCTGGQEGQQLKEEHSKITDDAVDESSSLLLRPLLSSSPPPPLTVLIPAYNEALRIQETLQNYTSYLEQRQQQQKKNNENNNNTQQQWNKIGTTSILVVDDGSIDDTRAVVEKFSLARRGNKNVKTNAKNSWEVNDVLENNDKQQEEEVIRIDCVSLPENRGKGAALAFGIQEICQRRRQQDEKQQYAQEEQNFSTMTKGGSGENDATLFPNSSSCCCNHHLSAAGLVLMADADGSASIEGLEDMYHAMLDLATQQQQQYADDRKTTTSRTATSSNVVWYNNPLVVVGYRTYESAAPSRRLFRWGFRTTVQVIMGGGGGGGGDSSIIKNSGISSSSRSDNKKKKSNSIVIRDGQCGFKLMTLAAALPLYHNLNLQQWSHDVEVLHRAKLLGIPVQEREIVWTDKDGSKLTSSPGGIVAVAARMFWDVVRLRWGYEFGGWT